MDSSSLVPQQGIAHSATVTIASHVLVLPAASVTVRITVFSPLLSQVNVSLSIDNVTSLQSSYELLSIKFVIHRRFLQ